MLRVRILMPFLNISACKPFQLVTQIKTINLNMSKYVAFKESGIEFLDPPFCPDPSQVLWVLS